MLLAEVLVMDFVRLADGHEISVLGAFEPGESLVNEHVMHEEIGQTVERDACANPKPEIPVDAP